MRREEQWWGIGYMLVGSRRRRRLHTVRKLGRLTLAPRSLADAPIMVVDSAIRGKGNHARRAISEYCAQRYLAWGDVPLFNDAYEAASSLWLRTGFKYLTEPISTPYRYATHDVTDSTKEIALRRGQPIPEGDKLTRYRTVPMVRWKMADRDAGDLMTPGRKKDQAKL